MARILAVDDSDQNLILIELYLKGPEFEVVTTRSGTEALQLVLDQDFDLGLLDVVMPTMGGFEICRRLKEDPRTAAIPVIFLSGRLRDEADKLHGYEIGAVDYITKPVDREQLLARIRVMLRLREARSELERKNQRLDDLLRDSQVAREALGKRVEALERLVAALEAPPQDAVFLLDASDRVVACNATAELRFGAAQAQQPLPVGLARLLQAADAGSRAEPVVDPQPAPGAPPGGRSYLVTRERLARAGGDPSGSLVTLRDVTTVAAERAKLLARELACLGVPARAASDRYAISGFTGHSAVLQPLVGQVDRLRQGRSTVLIYGESGTGKELVARALHYDGPYANRPFIPIHCGAISPELIESELFGHEKGAFTGAGASKQGLFAAADGGTIFLDEIAETSKALQVKLLRVLQLGEVRPVGATQPLRVDVRILAATNQDLLRMVREDEFREDLYYRLEVVTLHLPPLRDRLEDLPLLVDAFIKRLNRIYERHGKPVRGISRAALGFLESYPWPGNVRELENVIDRAFALGCGEIIQQEDLPERVLSGRPTLVGYGRPVVLPRTQPAPMAAAEAETILHGDLRARLDREERTAILHALEQAKGDKQAAAQSLGLSRSTFYRRLKDLGIPALEG